MMDESSKHILRALLLGLRDEMYRRFDDIGRKWSQLNHVDNESEVKAAIRKLTADLNLFESREVKEIEAIEKALNRVDSDMYGICESCGAYIAEQHLLAVPWASKCPHCAQANAIMMPFSANEAVRRP
jgi:RNA polymerase-binding transcription factor DksA